jgi:sphingomyelin phosphodiesterase
MGMFIFRFENTVTAIFNGHTHNDHFHVYYSNDEPTRPISVAVNGGSVTTFTYLNTNYKMYSVDTANYVSMSDNDRIQKLILWSPGT